MRLCIVKKEKAGGSGRAVRDPPVPSTVWDSLAVWGSFIFPVRLRNSTALNRFRHSKASENVS